MNEAENSQRSIFSQTHHTQVVLNELFCVTAGEEEGHIKIKFQWVRSSVLCGCNLKGDIP
jgi:hypothetical protein